MKSKKPIFILAPMDDVTDTVFRRIVSSCSSPDIFFTEFVNVDGLMSDGRKKLLPKLLIKDETVPVIVQLWGKDPKNFEEIARQVVNGSLAKEAGSSKNFTGIDLNFGCPDRTVVRNNTCSALIKLENRELATNIIIATQKGAGDFPVSVKTRLGFSEIDFSWHEELLKQKLNMLSIHARTVNELSKVPAHWDDIKHIVELRDRISPNTKIIINGDITDRSQGLEVAKRTNADGVMIGRGVFKDPYCFSDKSPWADMSRNERLNLLKMHIELFKNTWRQDERKFEPLRKFVKVYINGFGGASDLREKFMNAKNSDELLTLIDINTTTNP